MNEPPAVHVREAGRADLADVCAIVNHFVATSPVNFRTRPQDVREWESDWDRLHRRYPWLVATQGGGTVVGFSYARPWKDRGGYDWTTEVTVYVEPRAHGRGVGSALYAHLLDLLERQGFRSAVGVLGLPNEASVRLHERHGFVQAGVLTDAGFKMGRWLDVGFWQRTLSSGAGQPAPTLPVRDVLV